MLNDAHVRLREARERAGYRSAADFARRNRLPEVTYRSHENGTRGIGTQIARKYGALLDVSPAWLLTGEGVVESAGGSSHHAVIGQYIDTGLGGTVDGMAARHTYTLTFVPPRQYFHQGFFGAVVEGSDLPAFPHGSELIFAKPTEPISNAEGKYVLCEEQTEAGGRRRFFGRVVSTRDGMAIEFPAEQAQQRQRIPYLAATSSAGLHEHSAAVKKPSDALPLRAGTLRILGVLVKSMRNE